MGITESIDNCCGSPNGYTNDEIKELEEEIKRLKKQLAAKYNSLETKKEKEEISLFPYSGKPDGSIAAALKTAISSGIIGPDNPMIMFINLDSFRLRCNELNSSFFKYGINANNLCNAFAIKALQSGGLCTELNNLSNMGIECASFGELFVALKANTPKTEIVFDSPCKTINELKYCIENNIYLNLDNFEELNRVQEIIKILDNKKLININNINMGIRLNPVIGGGKIASHSTATIYSKFGVNMEENHDKLIKIYQENQPWLNAVHCHVGSQGMSIKQQTNGVKKVVDFVVNDLNEKNKINIKTIDIGGGLSVNFNGYQHKPTFTDYIESLHKNVPILFKNKYKIWTEFGRSLVAKTGFIASRVEYVKKAADKFIVIVHCGANIFIRNAYHPKNWKNYITVYDENGNIKNINNDDDDDQKTQLFKYDIAGPLCFSGDLIARNRYLPKINVGDYIIVHDAAAYTLSMYSMYNSRPFPDIYGFQTSDDNNLHFKLLKKHQTPQDIAQFWIDAKIEKDLINTNRLRCYKQIDISSLHRNMEIIQGMISKTGCQQICVLKADAYGHGAIRIAAECLKFNVSTFAVATVLEGIELRDSSNDMMNSNIKIIVLGASVNDEYELYAKYNLDIMLSSPEMAQSLINWCQYSRNRENKKLNIIDLHLMMDTGMTRIGFDVEDCLNSIRLIHKNSKQFGVKFVGLCTHFADSTNEQYTLLQFDRLTSVLTKLEDEDGINVEMFHCESSKTLMADIIEDKVIKSYLDHDTKGYVRTGSAIYGKIPPLPQQEEENKDNEEKVERILSLHAQIRHIQEIKCGESVGYDQSFIASEDCLIATLSIGYADGYPRGMSNKKQCVRIGDYLYDIAGKIAMDMMMVNLGNMEKNIQIKNIKIGDYAVLFGPIKQNKKNIQLKQICKMLGAQYNEWEITCSLNKRCPPVYIQ